MQRGHGQERKGLAARSHGGARDAVIESHGHAAGRCFEPLASQRAAAT